ncbi:hypothetical protein [Halobaculum rubrum]|uniref:hypothetical protein n=1 Tax=Halobaculum rubrum TaxID=2872158 RepID=UPI001CA45A7B|nr:hypothetical protein [Halobaculum rubrum]QZY00288.1 hypothetical protein K6T25_04090 [Halobaculum rubrum]
MPSITTRLSDGVDDALSHLPLALVPLVLAALDTGKIQSVLAFDGVHVGVRFTLPASVLSTWSLVSVPNGGGVDAGVPPSAVRSPAALALAVGGLLVSSALSAGYFGSLANALAGEPYRFGGHVRRYLPAFLVFTVAPVIALSPLVLLVGASSGLGIVVMLFALVAIAVATYLLYATPYLLVLRETDLLSATRASYALAVDGGAYLSYAVGFVAAVVVVSPVISAFVVSVPLVGLAVGLPLGAVLGLAGNLATMRFVADVDPHSDAFGTQPPEELGTVPADEPTRDEGGREKA